MHHARLYVGRNADRLLQLALTQAAQALAPTGKAPLQHPDCHLLDNEGKAIDIGLIRAWRRAAFLAPNEAPRHVFIMVAADTMNPYAQNALLALLEEPPTPCLFLLLCQNEDALLPTVRSRLYTIHADSDAPDFPPEAEAWSGQVLAALDTHDELSVLQALLSAEKQPRATLCLYLECLLAQLFDSYVNTNHLTDAHFFSMIERLRHARQLLNSNVGNGQVLAALAAEWAAERP